MRIQSKIPQSWRNRHANPRRTTGKHWWTTRSDSDKSVKLLTCSSLALPEIYWFHAPKKFLVALDKKKLGSVFISGWSLCYDSYFLRSAVHQCIFANKIITNEINQLKEKWFYYQTKWILMLKLNILLRFCIHNQFCKRIEIIFSLEVQS